MSGINREISLFNHITAYRFKHKVTGVKCETRALDCRGGLLLDEMGMGKSLSIIALIVHSLKEAEVFRAIQQNNPNQVSGRLRYKATLVITPKSSMYSTRIFRLLFLIPVLAIQSWLSEFDR